MSDKIMFDLLVDLQLIAHMDGIKRCQDAADMIKSLCATIDAKDAEIERLADSERYAWKNTHEINKQMVEQQAVIDNLKPLAEIGEKWQTNSSLEAWFPYTAEQIQTLTKERDDLLKRFEGKVPVSVDVYDAVGYCIARDLPINKTFVDKFITANEEK